MSLQKRIEKAVQTLKDFQNAVDDAKHQTGDILISISDFIDDDLDDLVEELNEISSEVGDVEEKLEVLGIALDELKEGSESV
ncbi:hypothetical protein NST04_28675 [Paenibacillus sp. FSL H7-0756]|uniref:hypothetical protein n=1 Tax=Paenibacillus sp. FSL H7-0756 TaxID=2954738 RepID=UPI0030F60A38